MWRGYKNALSLLPIENVAQGRQAARNVAPSASVLRAVVDMVKWRQGSLVVRDGDEQRVTVEVGALAADQVARVDTGVSADGNVLLLGMRVAEAEASALAWPSMLKKSRMADLPRQ